MCRPAHGVFFFCFIGIFFWKLRLSRHEGPCGRHQMFQALHFSVHVPNAIFMARRVHFYLFISSSCKSYAHQQFSTFFGLSTHLYFFSSVHCFFNLCLIFPEFTERLLSATKKIISYECLLNISHQNYECQLAFRMIATQVILVDISLPTGLWHS